MRGLILSFCVTALWGGISQALAADPIQFNREIRPILSDTCFMCHGPDQAKREAELRLDTEAGLVGTADQAGAVTPKALDKSKLWERINSTDPDLVMPPPSTGKKLSEREKSLIKTWIEQGAPYQNHWSYIPPTRPKLPEVPAQRPVRNAIDRFLAARQQTAGLTPQAEADRITLIRRLSFDLTGLPPTQEAVAAFVNDQRPDAYERLVEQLLDSPHYGERMAVYWLDLVRFADTIGYHSDNPRDIVPYRDYVIRSFQQNVPFDRFTIEQVAGDLLPNPTLTQRVASGYNRLLQTTEEGGSQPKEYMAKYSADRVRNIGAVWLGATMMCAECHNHKYDPYTQQDFYSLAAFFADVQEAAVGRREPGLPVPTAADEQKLKDLDDRIAQAERGLDEALAALLKGGPQWEADLRSSAAWETLPLAEAKVQGESHLHRQDDGSYRTEGKVAAKETYLLTVDTPLRKLTGLRLEALADEALPSKGPGTAPNGNYVLTEFKIAVIGADGKEQPVKLKHAVADHAQNGHAALTTIDGKNDTGWAVLPQIGQSHELIVEAEQPFAVDDAAAKFIVRLEFQSQFPQHNIGRLRLSGTTATQPASRWLPPAIRALLDVAAAERTADQLAALTKFLREQSVLLATARGAIQAAHEAKQQYQNGLPRSLITSAGAPRMIRVLARGNWMDDSGAVMEPAVPAFLGKVAPKENQRLNRLDLAQWLVAADNPLPARVMMNRFWKLFYGTGLSKTVEDLGSQGEWPTHPELLDWLAVEFRESGWDVKHMVRLMVTSQSYRQSSVLSPEARAADPFNRLLTAQNRFRLDAEFVRDNTLAIAGLLSPRIGGESVKPYQPDGYWDYLNFPRRTWERDKGEKLYRRGLYTHWQRSFLHPPLLIFDAPSREECVADRPRSNTPQQALVLLNEPAALEAARVFAGRIVQSAETDAARIDWAFRQATARTPSDAERSLLSGLLAKHRQQYAADSAAAEALLKASGDAPFAPNLAPTELAAWTSIARTLLNLHETITRL